MISNKRVAKCLKACGVNRSMKMMGIVVSFQRAEGGQVGKGAKREKGKEKRRCANQANKKKWMKLQTQGRKEEEDKNIDPSSVGNGENMAGQGGIYNGGGHHSFTRSPHSRTRPIHPRLPFFFVLFSCLAHNGMSFSFFLFLFRRGDECVRGVLFFCLCG